MKPGIPPERVVAGDEKAVAASVPRAQIVMLAGCLLAVLASFVAPPYPDTIVLQNAPAVVGIAMLWALLRRRPLGNAPVACVCAFVLLHAVGGRYAYSNVPYDQWLSGLGLPTVESLIGTTRNGYDRLVHFSFGLLSYPFVRALLTARGVTPRMATYVAIEFVLAFSCLYEIFEWVLTLVMAGADAEAYNGQQGDMWDAQKDMACATVGALLSALILRLRTR